MELDIYVYQKKNIKVNNELVALTKCDALNFCTEFFTIIFCLIRNKFQNMVTKISTDCKIYSTLTRSDNYSLFMSHRINYSGRA